MLLTLLMLSQDPSFGIEVDEVARAARDWVGLTPTAEPAQMGVSAPLVPRARAVSIVGLDGRAYALDVPGPMRSEWSTDVDPRDSDWDLAHDWAHLEWNEDVELIGDIARFELQPSGPAIARFSVRRSDYCTRTGPLTLNATSACAARIVTPQPMLLGDDPLEIVAEWDPTGLVQPTGLFLLVETGGEHPLLVPVDWSEEYELPFRIPSPTLAIGPDGSASTTVELSAPTAVEIERAPRDESGLQVRLNGDDPGRVAVEVRADRPRFDYDSFDLTVDVDGVLHRRTLAVTRPWPPQDAAGDALLYGLAVPGERVQVWKVDGRLRLEYPDRFVGRVMRGRVVAEHVVDADSMRSQTWPGEGYRVFVRPNAELGERFVRWQTIW